MRHYRPLPAHRKLALDARTEGRYGLCRCALDGGGGGASARGDDELDEQHHPRGHLLGVEVELGVVAHSPKGHALDMPGEWVGRGAEGANGMAVEEVANGGRGGRWEGAA